MSQQPQASSLDTRASSSVRPRIALIGYGDGAGREHARRLQKGGHDVRVAMLPGGMSWVRAVEDGFRPVQPRAAALNADVIVLLVPPEEVEVLYWEDVAPLARPGAMVIFADALDLDEDRLPKQVDVAVLSMSDRGCSVEVRVDATGRAQDRALDYLRALGGTVPRPPSSQVRVADEADPFPHRSMRVL